MGRNSWIMFGMVAIVIISILLVALLILVPQSEPVVDASMNEYESIVESDYSYTQSKDISQEAMKETYSITTEDVKEGKAAKLYRQGNTDPFAESSSTTSNGATTNNGNNQGSGSENSGTTNNGGSTNQDGTSGNGSSTNDRPYSAEDK